MPVYYLGVEPSHPGLLSTHWSFPTGSSLPSPDRAPGLGHLPTLPQRRRDGRASGVPVSGPRSRQEGHLARRHHHYRPATPLELPGTDWGGDLPPRPGMRERERGLLSLAILLSVGIVSTGDGWEVTSSSAYQQTLLLGLLSY